MATDAIKKKGKRTGIITSPELEKRMRNYFADNPNEPMSKQYLYNKAMEAFLDEYENLVSAVRLDPA